MAGKIKGITIEFDGNTTKLDKALKGVKQDAKGVDQELREINRALKFNPKNVELLKQKFDVMKQKIDATENELKQFKNIEKQLSEKKISKQSAEWRRVRREIIQTESKLKHYKAELMKVKYQNITNMGNAFKTAGSNMRMAGAYSTIGAAVSIAAGKKLLDLNSTQQQAENKLIEIYKTRMGVDEKAAKSTMKVAEALQKQGVIGDEVTLSGAQQLATYAKYPETVDKLLPAMDDLLVQQKGYNATAEDATGIANLFGKAMMGQTGALKKVGISFTDEQEAILKYGNEEERAAVLAEVVTDNVGNMNEVFAETDEGKMAQLKNTLGDMGEQLGAMLLPALGEFVDLFNEKIMPKLEQFMDFLSNHPGWAKVAVAIVAILAVAGPLLIFLGAIVSAVGVLLSSIGTLASVFGFLISPIGLVIAIIAALIVVGILLYKNWDKIKKKAAEIKKAVVDAFNNLKNRVVAIFNAIKTKINAIWEGIKSGVRGKVDAIKNFVVNSFQSLKERVANAFSNLKDKITSPFIKAKEKIDGIIQRIKGLFPISIGKLMSKIKLPHFNLEWGTKDFGKLGSIKYPTGLGVKWFAQGGIFNAPSIIGVGEAGSEAVVPLDKLWSKLDAMQGGIVININGANADPMQIAQEVKRVLIQETNRRRLAWQ